MTNYCIDCGAATSGARCRPCNGKFIALEAARDFDAEDRAILEEGVSGERLADRLGLSRQRGYTRIKDARRRQELLKQEGS